MESQLGLQASQIGSPGGARGTGDGDPGRTLIWEEVRGWSGETRL